MIGKTLYLIIMKKVKLNHNFGINTFIEIKVFMIKHINKQKNCQFFSKKFSLWLTTKLIES